MNNNRLNNYAILSLTSLITGILFFAFYNQWIIIQLPYCIAHATTEQLINKKKITAHYFHQERWKTETQEHLWTDSAAKNITQLINAWLIVLDEEHVIQKKTTLESVLVSQSGIAYLSFDHAIFSKTDSIFHKWMIIESLLKTLRSNSIPVQSVQLLVCHQPLNDPHLDFSMPWPIHGFMK